MVVLDKLVRDAEVGEHVAAVGLGEEPAVVAEYPRLEEGRPVDARLESFHGTRQSSRARDNPNGDPKEFSGATIG